MSYLAVKQMLSDSLFARCPFDSLHNTFPLTITILSNWITNKGILNLLNQCFIGLKLRLNRNRNINITQTDMITLLLQNELGFELEIGLLAFSNLR